MLFSLLTRQKCVLLTVLTVVTLVGVVYNVDVHRLYFEYLQKSYSTECSMLRISSEQHLQSLSPLVGDYTCQDALCRELLSEEEKALYEQCSQQMMNSKMYSPDNGPDAEKCHFINSTGRAPVALSSFPGSGNTWVRGLLEKATGICTGAVYCDSVLRHKGFAGECVTTGAVLVVKMHQRMTEETKEWYGAAIHLARNPFGVIVAEYNREMSTGSSNGGNHIKSLGKKRFGNSPEWKRYLRYKAQVWKSHFTSWTQNELDIPVLHVLYEDIKKDRVREVKRMLEFLGVSYSEEELRERLSEDFDLFHRSKHGDFDPYTPEQRQHVNQQIREAVDTVRTNNNGDALGFEVYLNN